MNIFYFIIIVVILIVLTTFILFSILEGGFDWDVFQGSLGLGAVGGVFALFFVSIYAFTASGEPYKSKTYEISALKDNSNVSGQSFIGTGFISENQYYFYMTETEKGKKMNKVRINDAYLNEGDYVPYVDVYSYRYKSKLARWLYGENKDENYEFVFFIPEDTITTEFNIDME